MKLKNLLDSLSHLLDADRREQVRKYDDMKKVLKKLKKKRNELREELETAQGEEAEKIRQRLDILVSQRRKGIAALKEIKSLREKEKS